MVKELLLGITSCKPWRQMCAIHGFCPTTVACFQRKSPPPSVALQSCHFPHVKPYWLQVPVILTGKGTTTWSRCTLNFFATAFAPSDVQSNRNPIAANASCKWIKAVAPTDLPFGQRNYSACCTELFSRISHPWWSAGWGRFCLRATRVKYCCNMINYESMK